MKIDSVLSLTKIEFEKKSAVLVDKGRRVLIELGHLLKQSEPGDFSLIVTGKSSPSAKDMKIASKRDFWTTLARDRAISCCAYLRSECGVLHELSVDGYISNVREVTFELQGAGDEEPEQEDPEVDKECSRPSSA
eukprot:NODE_1298_length_1485_cov_18.333565_g1079_i0.p3 GENE.NODE_1298_length_1485_cov_18.333565_g1079_i0~~NODE_1298_length_1485_cov_18.333565_g1079_i0.p3  ORF type:complete len:135 (-),score=37.38 NODE_1298_length_1485_cov_18.333565_g1079_i0:129-533(-)